LDLKKNEMVGQVASMQKKRGAYRVMVEKPEEKTQLGRPGLRWEDNIKMALQELGWWAWTVLVCLRIGTGVKLWGISSLAEELLVSQKGLYYK
jgi:hypothetical protein